ncbi:hypothetical protein [Pseudotabrizicola sp.]|uniref:hypothetical protein n=1 Tax=Pseudotabrizicola sp. TaxID=2939647 RepID=UPI0027297054|nr:hypothetical protein [Pseudotabrizicola sp.]
MNNPALAFSQMRRIQRQIPKLQSTLAANPSASNAARIFRHSRYAVLQDDRLRIRRANTPLDANLLLSGRAASSSAQYAVIL